MKPETQEISGEAAPVGPRRRRGRRVFLMLLLGGLTTLAALVVLLAALEGFSRLFISEKYVPKNASEEGELQYELSAFSRHRFPMRAQVVADPDDSKGVKYHINPYGYRGEAFSAQKPPGTFRVVVIGGSAVFDRDAPGDSDWPSQTGRMLRERGHANVECINAGIPGHASADGLGRYLTEIHAFQPDVTVIYFVWNDAKLVGELARGETALRAINPFDPNGDPRRFTQGPLDALLCKSRFYAYWRMKWIEQHYQLGPEGAAEPPDSDAAMFPPLDEADFESYMQPLLRQFRYNFLNFVDAARNAGSEPVIATPVTLVHPNAGQEDRKRIRRRYLHVGEGDMFTLFGRMQETLRAVAREKDCKLMDLDARFGGRGDLLNDHIHLSAAGSQAVAEATADFLEAEFREKLDGATR